MTDAALDAIAEFWSGAETLCVLTGAGCSTDSGIPDYRDRDGNWKHARPVMYADFMGSAETRQRYWARTTVGWQRMNAAAPGAAHTALAELKARGRINTLITQNVDGLHQAAGTDDVIDLHGRLDTVRCQQCGTVTPRADWQQHVLDVNPGWLAEIGDVRDAPDGDAIIDTRNVSDFVVPDCRVCGGIVKPEVVFFGENVPRPRVERAYAAVEAASGLLVAGSSLTVFSGFRFARRCHELGKPVFIVNQGKTRADDIATIRVDENCGRALGRLARTLNGATASRSDTRQ